MRAENSKYIKAINNNNNNKRVILRLRNNTPRKAPSDFTMAATRNGRSKQEPGPESEDSHSNGQVSGEACKMSLASKLMTSAILCGSEASAEFEHLYTMPVSVCFVYARSLSGTAVRILIEREDLNCRRGFAVSRAMFK